MLVYCIRNEKRGGEIQIWVLDHSFQLRLVKWMLCESVAGPLNTVCAGFWVFLPPTFADMSGSLSVWTMVTNLVQLIKTMPVKKAAKAWQLPYCCFSFYCAHNICRASLSRHLNAFIHYTSYPHERMFIEFHYFLQTKIRHLFSFTYNNTEWKGQDTCRIAAKSISVSCWIIHFLCQFFLHSLFSICIENRGGDEL